MTSTRTLQEANFGIDFNMSPNEFADYVTWNHSAAVLELSEFMDEVGWKPWASPRGWVNRDRAIGELVDAVHFIANLCVALDVTDHEWEVRYRNKQEINRRRQASGYTGRNKCHACGRADDDPDVRMYKQDGGSSLCFDCAQP